jgi:OmpA-OmpF porin, OOP family
MKKVFFITSLLCLCFFSHGQILKKIANRVKQKTESNTNNKSDTIANDAGNGKTDAKTIKPDTTADPAGKNVAVTDNAASIKSYSKYDFTPGEKIIGFEDFMTGNIGDFPAGWNTNAAAEIVTIEGKPGRWLMLTKPGVFVPEFTGKYPDDFTFEFDLLHGVPISGAAFTVAFAELQNIGQPQNWTLGNNQINFELSTANTGTQAGLTRYSVRKNSASEPANQFYPEILNDKNNPVHVSVWRQKERVRVYVNQEKLWDVPKGLAKEAQLNAIVFYIPYVQTNLQHYIGNLRLAIGAPDTRNKMLTQNKWVTHGILFDVNSANIKAESYGSLKEIANVLKENPDLKVKIVGHTDADGKDADNLDLSKRRAAAVKAALAKEFGIDENHMETDGKGESEPIDKNDNPAGKANNRRVEFIKV